MLTMNQRGLVRTAVSATEPVTLTEAKLYLRVSGTAEDDLITDLITVAREHAEQYLKKSLIDQDWRMTLDDYAPLTVRLPMGPVRSITSVRTIDSEDNATTISSANYQLKNDRDAIEFDSIPYADHIEISYETGYASVSDIPTSIKYGMLAHIAVLYELRGEGKTGIPEQALALYAPHKEVLL